MGFYIKNLTLPKNVVSVFMTMFQEGAPPLSGTIPIELISEIDIVPCKECKHRPVKEDPNGEDYGFNLVEPNEEDDVCPCLVEDGWYSWMPEDNFHCGRGERIDNE